MHFIFIVEEEVISSPFAPQVLKPVATGGKELSFMDHLKALEGNGATGKYW